MAPAVLLVLKDDTVFTTPSARREAAFLQKEYQELEGMMVYCSAEVMPGVLNFLGASYPASVHCFHAASECSLDSTLLQHPLQGAILDVTNWAPRGSTRR